MKNANYKLALYIFISVFLTFGLTVSLQSILADWTAPTGAPPADNIAPPIFSNSTISQTITGGGGLAITGPIAATRAAFPGWISGDGDDEGLIISADGTIEMNSNNSGGPSLYVNNIGANPEIALGDSSSYWSIYSDELSGDLRFWRGSDNLVISQYGSVGLGVANPTSKLEVSGSIKVGYDPAPCDNTKAGAIRFNPGNKRVEICNGSHWRLFMDEEVCVPDCIDKDCGDDGCGGFCGALNGACSAGFECNSEGKCEACGTCASKGYNCGVYCGQTCLPNSCADDEECKDYVCVYKNPPGCTLPYTGGTTWRSDDTGNAACVASGYSKCVAAYDGDGHSISCSNSEYSGTALCQEPTCTGTTWRSDDSGSGACAAAGRTCLAAYNGNGSSITCGNSEYSGSARCSETATYGTIWWSSNDSGNGACAAAGRTCLAAYNGNGSSITCDNSEYKGSARCSLEVTYGVTWTSNDTGSGRCSSVGRTCLAAYDGDGHSISCGNSEYSGSARCSGTIGYGVTWTSNNSGSGACAAIGRTCLAAYDGDGHSISCGNSEYSGSAMCDSSGTHGVTWSDRSSGSAECAAAGYGICVVAYSDEGYTIGCGSSYYGGSAICN